jgi:predicted TIM-barrel fold metal-dependent hydrolase
MLIADSQVHIWAADTPERPWPKRHAPHRKEPLTKDEMLREMDAAGVDRVVIVPPGWEGDRVDLGIAAAQAHPTRFAVMGRFDPEAPDAPQRLATWMDQPGMLGVRVTFNTPQLEPLLTEGKFDWFWPAAERADIPVMILAPHRLLHLIGGIAAAHPGLRIAIDHLGVSKGTKAPQAFAGLDQLLALSGRSNVAVKASSLPAYSTQPYPFRDVHEPVRRAYDAFGPRRMFWGSDFSKLKCTYREAVTLFTEELPWLTHEDKEWIMGRALCQWLNWA